MIIRRIPIFYLLLFFIALLAACRSEDKMFSLISSEESGIIFNNRITDNDTMNILDFEYIYNGGGVGIGDFNNDGLQDVFFSGNQVPCQLYLNKGDFEFEDITQSAGVSGNGKWASGVALVDINNDGWMDIYVGATVKKTAQERANMLFVNQGLNKEGKPTFKEQAKQYGIDDTGHTTNAAFFDYDNDGDLDLYVLTNTVESYPNRYRKKVTDGSSPTTDRLYRNDWNAQLKQGVFTNVSKEAGIQIEGYGLGVNITDINRDGWKDIYVTNDYITNDLLYINNGNGTFNDRASEYFKHTSNSAMGNDVNDINNDGLVDVIAVDMLPEDNLRKKMLMGANMYQTYFNNDQYGYTYEYVRNTLQLNQGPKPATNQPIFSEISLLAKVAETDWSWTPMVVDFDHDGYRDLLVTNGFPKDVTDRDFIQYRSEVGLVASKEMMLSQIPVIRIKNYAFRNNGDLTFSNVTDDWGMTQASFSNGAAYGDLDNDGDLDYIVNNINDEAFVFRNNLIERKAKNANYLRMKFQGPAQNRMGLGTFIELTYGNGQKQVYEHTIYRGYISSIENAAHFGLGSNQVVDQVKITWPNGSAQLLKNVQANQVLTIDIKNAHSGLKPGPQPEGLLAEITDSLQITFTHQEPDYIDFNVQKLLPHKLTQYPPAISAGDINGDGLNDLFIGGSRFHKGKFLLQTASGSFAEKDLLPGPDGETKLEEDMGTLLFDVDGDKDLDLYIASGGYEKEPNTAAYQDRLYINDGKGNFQLSAQALPAIFVSKSCVKAADFDKDGDLDLFVGGRVETDRYPKPVSSFIFRNDTQNGQVKFTDVTATIANGLQQIGLVCDAIWTDYDNDGWVDLMLAGEWMPLTILQNRQGKFENITTQTGLQSHVGWWNSLTAADFDKDGDIDYVAGNLGLNSLNHASDKEPVRIYAKDFDGNGSFDAIPTTYFPDETGVRREYSFHGREDLIKQMISMRARFPYYKNFARATVDSLVLEKDRKDALILKANYMQSAYIENVGNGKFNIKSLPVQAQFAPLFGMISQDVDGDGNIDLMAVGNDFSNEVSTGRYDALNGLWLKGNGKGEFAAQSLAASGFFVPGNAKGLLQFTDAKGNQLIAASQNRGRLCIFKNQKGAMQHVPLNAEDAYALLTYQDGQVQKEELYYGSSFLSQSPRELLIPKNIKDVELIDFKGNKRKVLWQAGL
ncbi:VCBS repeat-containing protein [Rhodocytophaga rosea]|uniref:VCBS repeat-containing protein n=1 Tax=Rhodocytophaga rosea TaxID=2704465 RepID=A0A6C0GK71_9BACT|nr:VCBS repeat-containing protein [Rhodocytophaga rosea]QHT68359.1 VCBS repeat-containing protein [Rhodocytophaga rosea]